MSGWREPALALVLLGLMAHPMRGAADEDDEMPAQSAGASTPALNHEQQQAAGIGVAHPIEAAVPARLEALGLVLDAAALISDDAELSAAAAAQRSSAAELARLHALYEGGGASLKTLQAAQAEYAKSRAQEKTASSRFALRWGPLADLPPAARQTVIDDVGAGHSQLLRADLPGRHSIGALPPKALVDVDGVQVPGRVLGALRQSGDVQSAGVLIEVRNAPAGFGPGARVAVILVSAERKGLLLPRDAILYDEGGAYVYKQLAHKPGEEKTRYAPVKVTLLAPSGDGWLVTGVDDDDAIVVHGAGVLWSLQEVGGRAVEDDDED